MIPVYNSREILPLLVERVRELFATFPKGRDCELILVNDGSRDGSSEAIQELRTRYPFIVHFDLMRNYGQHNALLCGIRAARNPVIITMDDDLQHPPEEIPTLLQELDRGFDVVYGSPKLGQHGLLRNLASRVTKAALQTCIGAENARHASAFRALRTQVRQAFAEYRSPFLSLDVLLTWGTVRFSYVFVRHDARQSGTSHYSVPKLLRHAVNMATGFSTLPLQMASMIGFAFTLFGVAVLLYVLIRYFVEGGSVPGFPFLASVIAIFSGAQLFALGIIGEYLARMHFRTMEKPTYVIREMLTEPASAVAEPENRLLPESVTV